MLCMQACVDTNDYRRNTMNYSSPQDSTNSLSASSLAQSTPLPATSAAATFLATSQLLHASLNSRSTSTSLSTSFPRAFTACNTFSANSLFSAFTFSTSRSTVTTFSFPAASRAERCPYTSASLSLRDKSAASSAGGAVASGCMDFRIGTAERTVRVMTSTRRREARTWMRSSSVASGFVPSVSPQLWSRVEGGGREGTIRKLGL
jgi:hypothetical protein